MQQANGRPTRDLIGAALANFLALGRGLSPRELDERFSALPEGVREACWTQLVAALDATREGAS